MMDVQVLHNHGMHEARKRVGPFVASLQKLGVTLKWEPIPTATGYVGHMTGHVSGTVWVRERDVYLRGTLGFLAKTALGEARVKREVDAALLAALA